MEAGYVADDTERIEAEIEAARNQLASTLDELAVRANPKRLVASTKESVVTRLSEPEVKYALMGVGAAIGLLIVVRFLRR